MARTLRFSKDELINGGVSFIQKYGIESMCARNVSEFIGCSTQPIFKNFSNFDEFKKSIKEQMYNDYKIFINEIIEEEHHLFTISYGYALYSKTEKNIFNALFNTSLAGTRTIEKIINAEKNSIVIKNSCKEFNISKHESEELFIKTRFFTHGISMQLSSETLEISDDDLKLLIKNTIAQLLEGGKYEKNI